MAERLSRAGRSRDWAQQVKHMAAGGANRAKDPQGFAGPQGRARLQP
jgi:hypothetical protein